MGAHCKLRSSKPGKGRQQTSVRLKRHSITVHGATAKRDSANTPKRWKRRRPHNIWRSNHAPLFVRHASPGDALGVMHIRPGNPGDANAVASLIASFQPVLTL